MGYMHTEEQTYYMFFSNMTEKESAKVKGGEKGV